LSHPFVARLIDTIRRKLPDQVLFCNAKDLEQELADFHQYYKLYRVHTALDGITPAELSEKRSMLASITCDDARSAPGAGGGSCRPPGVALD